MTLSKKTDMTDCKIYFAGRDSIPEKIVLGTGDRLDMLVVVLPGVCCDIPLNIVLEGEGASVNLGGVYVCPGEEKVGIDIVLEHKAGGCFSSQDFKGIVGGRAKVGFYGRIIVAHDAQKTEAYQSDHNLLLSDTATVSTRPQLEIYADDVKCSHGATVGKLDEEAQFYMRSRGVPEDEAKKLQMLSFLSPVLEMIEDAEIRESVAVKVEEAVRSII